MKSMFTNLCLFVGTALLATPLHAEELQITAPMVLPRGCPLIGYSPLVRLQYSALQAEDYTLKVWLLETGNYHLGSTQWCPLVTRISRGKQAAPDGELLLHPDMDVFSYTDFLWVARLYDITGREVASSQSPARSVEVTPALLQPIPTPVARVGQQVRIRLESTPSGKGPVAYRMQNSPPGSSLDSKTGVFTWTPTNAGTSRIVFEVVTGDSKVADSEVVTFDIAPIIKDGSKE